MRFSKRVIHFLRSIRAIGSDVEDNDIDEGPFCCPVHTDYRRRTESKTLHITVDPDLGLVLRCSSVRCAYVGDAVHILAHLRGIKPSTAIVKFQDGEEFEGALYPVSTKPMDTARINIYKSELSELQELLEFMDASVAHAKRYSGVLRSALSNLRVRYDTVISQGCGISDGNFARSRPRLPAKLTAYRKLLMSDVLLLPYYHAHILTGIAILSPIDGTTTHVRLRNAHCGLLLSETFSWPSVTHLICVEDTLECIKLNSKISAIAPHPMNITRPMHPNSITTMAGIESVTLLDTKESPVTFAEALPYARMACDTHIGVGVISITCDRNTSSMGGRDLYRILNNPASSVCIWDFMTAQLQEGYVHDDVRGVHDILNFAKITITEQRMLATRLEDRDAPEDLLYAVRSAACRADDIQLGGAVYQRMVDHYAMAAPSYRVLSDFAIYLDYVTTDAKGGLVYVGKVKTTVVDEPLYPVVLSAREMSSRGKSHNLGTIVWNQLKKLGSRARLYCDSLDAGDWATLIRSFDDAPFVPATVSMGALADGSFHLPRGGIRMLTGNVVRSADVGLTVPDCVKEMYRLVPATTSKDDLNALSQILRCNSPTVVPYLAYLACVAANAVAAMDPAGYQPRHVLLPMSGNSSLWELDMRKLAAAMCGTPKLLRTTSPAVTSGTAMGTLPLLCDSSARLLDAVYASPAPLIGIISKAHVAALVHTGGTLTVTAADGAAFDEEALELTAKAVAHVVACTTWAVQTCIPVQNNIPGDLITPCIGHLYKKLGIDIPQSVRSCFDPIVTEGDSLEVFFRNLRTVTSNGATLAPSFKAFRDSDVAIGVTNVKRARVYLSHQKTANAINMEFGTTLTRNDVQDLLLTVKGCTSYSNEMGAFGSMPQEYWTNFVLRLPSLFTITKVGSDTNQEAAQ